MRTLPHHAAPSIKQRLVKAETSEGMSSPKVILGQISEAISVMGKTPHFITRNWKLESPPFL